MSFTLCVRNFNELCLNHDFILIYLIILMMKNLKSIQSEKSVHNPGSDNLLNKELIVQESRTYGTEVQFMFYCLTHRNRIHSPFTTDYSPLTTSILSLSFVHVTVQIELLDLFLPVHLQND